MSSCSNYRIFVAVFVLFWTVCCGQNGYYGTGQSCGKCDGGISCDNVTGNCMEGCEPGYDPRFPKCNTNCTDSYGPKCGEECHHCEGGKCDHITGHCPRGCQVGFLGLLCDVACPAGTYGQNCTKRCGQCADADEKPCNHVTGICTRGCQPGYTGSLCDVECPDGKWGDNCNKTCGHCAANSICRKDDGLCPLGCELNFLMPNCADLPPQPWSNCSCQQLYIFEMTVYALSPALGVVLLIMIVTSCILCHRHRSSSRSLRALRQETKLNEVHRQLKETLVPWHSHNSPSQSPRGTRVSSFALGHGVGRRNGGDAQRNAPIEVSEGGTGNDEDAEEYQNWNLTDQPFGSGPAPHRQPLYLDTKDSASRKPRGCRGGPNTNRFPSAGQEEIYVNEL